MEQFNKKIKFSININTDTASLSVNGKNKKYSGFPKQWQNLTESKLDNKKNGIAILTGEINNLLVIDFDKEEGMNFYNKYLYLFEDTFIEDSTNGYKHVYFIYDKDFKTGISKLNNKIDILSDGKCCVMTNNNNGNKIKKINQQFKYLLLNGEDNDNDSNISTESIDSNNSSNNSSVNNIYDEYNELCELLDIMPECIYDNYDSWNKIGFVIFNITDKRGYKIWEHFSKVKNYKKYIKNTDFQMMEMWKKFKIVETYNESVLFQLIENTNNKEYIKLLEYYKIKYNYIIKKTEQIYNYFDETDFYFNDLVDNLVSTEWKTIKDCKLYLRDNLHRVLAIVNDYVILKSNKENFYNMVPFDKSGLKNIKIEIIGFSRTSKINFSLDSYSNGMFHSQHSGSEQ
jgi:hypothetical protein